MNIIYKCEFGSIIYGTNTPTSDQDYKAIYLPTKKEILLQNVKRVVTRNTKESQTSRNTENDVDDEAFSLQEYMRLLLKGETAMIDMVFTPKKHWLITSDIWEQIIENKHLWLHKGTTQYISYCRAQAAKYGIKGSRVAAARKVHTFLLTLSDPTKTFNSYIDEIENDLFKNPDEYIKKYHDLNNICHLEVCGRKIPYNSRVNNGIEILQKILDNAGHRALQAEKNENIDWKAIYHAIRCCEQGKELLVTGQITFPRPEAELLLKVRNAELPYKQCAEIIENGLDEIEELKLTSLLPEEPNHQKSDELICSIYEGIILNEKKM